MKTIVRDGREALLRAPSRPSWMLLSFRRGKLLGNGSAVKGEAGEAVRLGPLRAEGEGGVSVMGAVFSMKSPGYRKHFPCRRLNFAP